MQKAFAVAGVVAAAGSPHFEKFEQQFGRVYASADERAYRLKVFADNLKLIEETNAKNLSYKLGITKFADMTFDEFRAQLGDASAPAFEGLPKLGVHRAAENFVAADSVDWVAQGAVTSVKNQGSCGSCWTFSTAGALEGAAQIAGNALSDVSEQNILDCDSGGNKCNGGSMRQAFSWIQSNGICTLDSYPYACVDKDSSSCTESTCQASSCTKVPWSVTGYTAVDATEDALESALTQQPVSVAIEADQTVFQHYTSGLVTSSACGTALDHGVLAVGFGVDGSDKYWKVKNSWGSSWGENGYVRILRGSSVSGGECGILKQTSYPHVGGSSEIVV